MNLEEAKKILEITPQERDTLAKYSGFWHTVVNSLANMTPDTYNSLNKNGWKMVETKEELRKAIEIFVNIYSAMYKNSRGSKYSGRLIRGTGGKDIRRIYSSTDQFLSTTTSEEIAKTFSHYGDDALARIRLGEGVPYIDMTFYRDENSRNEQEILIAPFCKVSKNEFISKWKGYSYYELELSKPELQEMGNDEINSLQETILESFEKNLSDIKDFIKYKETIEILDEKIKNAKGDREYQREIYEEKEKTWDKLDEKRRSTYEYQSDLRRLLEGMCKQKELEIDRAYETIEVDRQNRLEEIKRQNQIVIRQNTFNDFNNSIDSTIVNSSNLCERLDELYSNLNRDNINFQNLSETLQIPKYSNKTGEIGEKIENIKEVIKIVNSNMDEDKQNPNDETISIQDILQKSRDVSQYEVEINMGNNISSDLDEFYSSFKKDMNFQIKEDVLKKSLDIIRKARLNKYKEELQQLYGQKVSFFGRLFGKENLRQEQIKNLELKIQGENIIIIPQAKETNGFSVRNTLAELYTAYNEVGDEHGKEIAEYYNVIKSVFGQGNKAFSDETIAQIAEQKMFENPNLLPVPIGYKEGTRSQTVRLKSENAYLQSRNEQKMEDSNNSFKRSYHLKEDYTLLMLNELTRLEDRLQDNKYYEMQDRKQNEKTELEDTAELFPRD